MLRLYGRIMQLLKDCLCNHPHAIIHSIAMAYDLSFNLCIFFPFLRITIGLDIEFRKGMSGVLILCIIFHYFGANEVNLDDFPSPLQFDNGIYQHYSTHVATC